MARRASWSLETPELQGHLGRSAPHHCTDLWRSCLPWVRHCHLHPVCSVLCCSSSLSWFAAVAECESATCWRACPDHQLSSCFHCYVCPANAGHCCCCLQRPDCCSWRRCSFMWNSKAITTDSHILTCYLACWQTATLRWGHGACPWGVRCCWSQVAASDVGVPGCWNWQMKSKCC